MRHRKGRSALTAAGIILGVAIFFGVLVSNATAQRGVDDLIVDLTGRADVLVDSRGAFGSSFPARLIGDVAALPDVETVTGFYGFGTTLTRHDGDSTFRADGAVRGVDLEEARLVQPYEFIDGRPWQPDADEVVISQRMRDALDTSIGEQLAVQTKLGPADVTVVGVLADRGAGRSDEGTVAFTSLATARRLDARGAVLRGAWVILDEGTDVDAWISNNGDLNRAVEMRNAADLAEGFKQFLTVFGTILTFFAAITLFVGAFLIYLTLSTAVVERTRAYGTLRALGATRRQVRRVVVGEAVTLGAVSSLIGLGVGLLVARGLLSLMSALFELDLPGLAVSPVAVVAGLVIGLGTTLAASIVPARRASKLAPVIAMKGDHARDTELGRAWIVGAAIAALSILVIFLAPGAGVGSLATIGLLLGTVLCVPLLLRPLAAVLGRLTKRIVAGVGEIAVLHLVRERSRSAYTLALIMVVLAMLFATGGLFLSVNASVDDLIDRQFGGDAYLDADGPIPDDVLATIEGRPDVQTISGLGAGQGTAIIDGERHDLFMQFAEPKPYFEAVGFLWIDGDDATASAALQRGEALLVSKAVSDQLELGRGDSVVLDTRQGEVTFEVAGVYATNPGPPSVALSFADGREHFGADRPFFYLVDLAEGTDPLAFQADIEEGIGAEHGLQVDTATTEKAQARSEVLQFFQIIYAILGVATVVGLLGLANTLAMSVLQRFREIGILRAIGVTRSQTWRMILVESATMGLTAFLLSVPLGWILTAVIVSGSSDAFGFAMPTIYPWLWVPVVAAFAFVTTIVAAIAPGRRAARLEVVGALQYE